MTGETPIQDPTPIHDPAPAPVEPKPNPTPDPTPGPAPAPVEPKPKEDWRDKRIGVLTAQKSDLQKQIDELRGQLDEAKKGSDGKLPPEEVERLASEKAKKLSQQDKFTEACNAVAAAGKAAFDDFDAKIAEFNKIVDGKNPKETENFTKLLEIAIDVGDAHRLLYELGSDLTEAQRILNLSPTKMAVELSKIKPKDDPKDVSGAPKPITPVGGRGGSHEKIDPSDPERSDGLTTRQWMERRNAQVAERARAGRGR